MSIDQDDVENIYLYGANSGHLRQALRMACLTPANAPLLYDVSSHEFKTTPLGDFLFIAGVVAEKVIRRNVGMYASATIDDPEARYWASGKLGFKDLPAWNKTGPHREADFHASADEVGRFSHLISPKGIITVINFFAYASHMKEQPQYINELSDAWRVFRSFATYHPVFSQLISTGWFLNDLVDHGLQAVIEQRMNSKITETDIARTLQIHERFALAYGGEPRTTEIRALLDKYKGLMRPIILPYRKQAAEIVRARRSEFDRRYPFPGTRVHFLRNLNDPDLTRALYSLGFPHLKLEAMTKRGSFGQTNKGSGKYTNPHFVTVEHMTPLTAGDNFTENFALATAGANEDMERLVRYQTDFLPSDEIERRPNEVLWKTIAPTVDIIALRPPFMSYGANRKFPSFMKHPGWDWKKG